MKRRTYNLREVIGSLHQLCAVPAQLAGVALVEAQPRAVSTLLGRQLHATQAALDEVLRYTEPSYKLWGAQGQHDPSSS